MCFLTAICKSLRLSMSISCLCQLTRPGSGQSPFACHPAFDKAWQLEQCQPVGSLALIKFAESNTSIIMKSKNTYVYFWLFWFQRCIRNMDTVHDCQMWCWISQQHCTKNGNGSTYEIIFSNHHSGVNTALLAGSSIHISIFICCSTSRLSNHHGFNSILVGRWWCFGCLCSILVEFWWWSTRSICAHMVVFISVMWSWWWITSRWWSYDVMWSFRCRLLACSGGVALRVAGSGGTYGSYGSYGACFFVVGTVPSWTWAKGLLLQMVPWRKPAYRVAVPDSWWSVCFPAHYCGRSSHMVM